MQYRITLKGLDPGLLVHNGYAVVDIDSPEKLEIEQITKKRGSDRTAADVVRLRELECLRGFYTDEEGFPTLPGEMLRAVIEEAARKTKQGPAVREGLIVLPDIEFDPGEALRGIPCTQLATRKDVQHIAKVNVQRSATTRCRPLFRDWHVAFTADVYEDLVDEAMLRQWLHTAGRRIGIGDWRPGKSGGVFGRFEVVSIDPVEEE